MLWTQQVIQQMEFIVPRNVCNCVIKAQVKQDVTDTSLKSTGIIKFRPVVESSWKKHRDM